MTEHSKDDVVRAEILAAAGRVFKKWGSVKTTMEDIAKEAGKGKSTLYYYFQSKDEIFETLVHTELKDLLARAKQLAETGTTAREKILRYLVGSLREINTKSSGYTIIKDELRQNQKFIRKLREMFREQEERYIETILRAGVKNGEFSFIQENEITIASQAIFGMVQALELYLALENEDGERFDIAARFIASLF
jgi:AcrR family transcriptional regulator